MSNLVRIPKHLAKKLFVQDKAIILCPCKMNPRGPFSMGCTVLGKEYLEKAESYRYSICWKGSIEKTAWSLMYNNWAFFNVSSETGKYAHYYVEYSDIANHTTLENK